LAEVEAETAQHLQRDPAVTMFRAYVVGPPLSDVDQPVAGVSLFMRTLLHLQSAGIREVVLHACPQFTVHDPRITVDLRVSEGEPVGPALVVPLGTVWHPAVGKRLARTPLHNEQVIAAGADGASIYAAGDRALAPLIENLSEHKISPETVSAPEFVMLPTGPRQADSLLLQTLYKPTDGFISRHLNRAISLRVTRLLLPTGITPNQMTLIAAVIGVAGVMMAWRGGYWQLLVAALLLQTQSILDGCDGEIARLKHLHSSLGEWLDQIFDDVVNIGFLVAVGHALSISGSFFAPFAWPIAMATLVLHTMYQIGLYAALFTKGGGRGSVTAIKWRGQGPPKAPPTTVNGRRLFAMKKLFEDASRRDFFTFLYVPCALLGCIEVAFVWHALIAALSGLFTTSQWLLLGGPETADS
jgi:phosphatidylglycerophosphate synthase